MIALSLLISLVGIAGATDGEIQEKPALVLGQGEQRFLRIPGLHRFSLGSDAVRSHPSPDRSRESLLLKGIRPGAGDLWVWKEDGSVEHRTIRVEKVARDDLKPGLQKALELLQEVEILYSGTGVVLRGMIQSVAESARVAAVVQGFPGEVQNQAEVSERLLAQGRQKLVEWIGRNGLAGRLRVDAEAGQLWVRGSLENLAAQANVTRNLRHLFPLAGIELESLPDSAPTVHFKVFLLELNRKRFGSFGVGWPAQIEGAFRVSPTGIQDSLALDLALQAMEGDGSARILSNPELVVRAPGDAELFAGGELPLQLRNRSYMNVVWKNFGLTLKLKVTHSTAEKARLEIFTEVSHLDSSIAIDEIPGLQTNRMKTQVDARYGAPLLLSGLLQQGTREAARGLPLLRQIPVLGSLFGSEDYLNERSELVAILLPNSSAPRAPMHKVESEFPRGMAPPPRNWITPREAVELKASSDYPWNALR